MTDKVQKIREKVKKLHGNPYYMMAVKDVLAIIDSMQLEEIPPKFPLISPKKCMYTKDDFTDEDRKVLCDGCEEECKYAQKEEPVSEDLEEAANFYADTHTEWFDADNNPHVSPAFKAGAQWQKKQMMAKAIDVEVKVDAGGYPYISQMELYDYDKDEPLAKEEDKYKVVLIKEE